MSSFWMHTDIKTKENELSSQLKDINKMISELELKSETFLKTSKSKDPFQITSVKKTVEMSLKVFLTGSISKLN
jgi:hypothetical protein